jgi:hypothetical protein
MSENVSVSPWNWLAQEGYTSDDSQPNIISAPLRRRQLELRAFERDFDLEEAKMSGS